MKITMRSYTGEIGITSDYYLVRNFFIQKNHIGFCHGRWDWMITHSMLDHASVGKIGLWFDGADLVGVATFDVVLGNAYIHTLPGYDALKGDMLVYAESNLTKDGDKAAVVIPDEDSIFQEIAAKAGYMATPDRESDAIYPIVCPERIAYGLPEGFRMTSMAETYDIYQYGQVMWKGFNHELDGEGPYMPTPEYLALLNAEMQRENVDLNLKIAVVAPNGNFASYCGMWYEPKSGFSLVEPVATDPDYRKMGLGRAAVLEGVKRCGALGAKAAYVGSSQQFYYSIGFRPAAVSSIWVKR